MTFLYKADAVRGAHWARLFAEKAPHIVIVIAEQDVGRAPRYGQSGSVGARGLAWGLYRSRQP